MTEQLQYPPALIELADGTVTFATVEQDSDMEIRASVSLLCDIRPGQLPWDRQRGTPSPLGMAAAIAGPAIEAAISRKDPRAVVSVRVVERPGNDRALRLKLVTA